jgi:dTMP kinase
VVQDRYLDSSIAYQGAGRVLDADEVRDLSTWATEGLLPDMTVLLDLDPVVARVRRGDRAAEDRLEAEHDQFHERVREAFLALAAASPDRFLVVDAALPADEIAARIRAAVEPLLDR